MTSSKLIQLLPGIGIFAAAILVIWGYLVVSEKEFPIFFHNPATPNPKELQLADLRLTNAIAREQNTSDKIAIQRTNLHRDATIAFIGYVTIPVISLFLTTAMVISWIVTQQKRANLTTVTLPGGSVIPVERRYLHEMTPIIHNLTLAQITAANGGNAEQSWAMAQQIIESSVAINRSLGMDKRPTRLSLAASFQAAPQPSDMMAVPSATPGFAELHAANQIATDHGLLIGFHPNGIPAYRALADFKSVAIGGEQRSGKSYAAAYFMMCFFLYYRAQIHILDMHWQNEKSLTQLMRPMIDAGHITSHNPIDTLNVITQFNVTIDRRLQGHDDCTTPLILVIDETLSLIRWLTEQKQLPQLVNLMKRCGEETAKANVMLIAIAHRWTQKDIGDAQIRQALNSIILLRQHPDQANLFLRNPAQSRMIRNLKQPGDALIMISYDSEPAQVRIPFISRGTIEEFASSVKATANDVVPTANQQAMLDTQSVITTMQWDDLCKKITAANLVQQDVAKRCGLSASTYSRILKGEQRTEANYAKLAQFFATLE